MHYCTMENKELELEEVLGSAPVRDVSVWNVLVVYKTVWLCSPKRPLAWSLQVSVYRRYVYKCGINPCSKGTLHQATNSASIHAVNVRKGDVTSTNKLGINSCSIL